MPGFWKQQGRLVLIVTVVVLVGLLALAWLVRADPEKGMFFYDAR